MAKSNKPAQIGMRGEPKNYEDCPWVPYRFFPVYAETGPAMGADPGQRKKSLFAASGGYIMVVTAGPAREGRRRLVEG